MSQPPISRDSYLVKSVVYSSKLLSTFCKAGASLPLREIVNGSGPSENDGFSSSFQFTNLYTQKVWHG